MAEPLAKDLSKGYLVELENKIRQAIADGIFAGSDTVTTALANIVTERNLH